VRALGGHLRELHLAVRVVTYEVATLVVLILLALDTVVFKELLIAFAAGLETGSLHKGVLAADLLDGLLDLLQLEFLEFGHLLGALHIEVDYVGLAHALVDVEHLVGGAEQVVLKEDHLL